MSAGIEVERRFLVCGDGWRGRGSTIRLRQGFLSTANGRVVRVRLAGERAVLTVKGRRRGAERVEIECPVPAETARAILDAEPSLVEGCVIDKLRHTIRLGSLVWQVDEFAADNAGLVIAECEYDSCFGSRADWERALDTERPAWIGAEITDEDRYYNHRLALRPFAHWSEAERAAALGPRGAG